jgi:uroporphyrinogen-III decarboxylase
MPDNRLELWKQRDERLRKALNYEPVDRIPVLFSGGAWAPIAMGLKLSTYCTDPDAAFDVALEAMDSLPGLDGSNPLPSGLITPGLTAMWLSKIKVPGIELSDDALWQVEENETMRVEDYDIILNKGWEAFMGEMFSRVQKFDLFERSNAWMMANGPGLAQRYYDRGYALLCCMATSIPFEALCGARSMEKFYFDCYRMPDKVKAALDIGQQFYVNLAIHGTKMLGIPATWVGGWRAASALVSRKIWDKLVFPYFHDMITQLHDNGISSILHFDQNWDRDLKRFLEFPKGCVFAPDGATNIRLAKEILGDHVAFLGDVPPAMLAAGTPDDVRTYVKELIRDLGPTGLIMHSGCDIPFNAPRSNVEAMIEATYEFGTYA